MCAYFGFCSHTVGKSSAGPAAAAAGSSSSASSSGPSCSDGSFRAGKGPGAVAQDTGLWQVHARDEHGVGFLVVFDEGSDIAHPLSKGDMVFSSISPLPGVRGRISLPTSLCMLSVPSRKECCLYDTGMHMSRVSCGHTTSLTVGTLLSLNSLRWLLCCVNWFLYCESLPAIFNHMWFTFHLHVLTIKNSIDYEICTPLSVLSSFILLLSDMGSRSRCSCSGCGLWGTNGVCHKCRVTLRKGKCWVKACCLTCFFYAAIHLQPQWLFLDVCLVWRIHGEKTGEWLELNLLSHFPQEYGSLLWFTSVIFHIEAFYRHG